MKIFGIILIIFGAFGFIGTLALSEAVSFYSEFPIAPSLIMYSCLFDVFLIIIGAVLIITEQKNPPKNP